MKSHISRVLKTVLLTALIAGTSCAQVVVNAASGATCCSAGFDNIHLRHCRRRNTCHRPSHEFASPNRDFRGQGLLEPAAHHDWEFGQLDIAFLLESFSGKRTAPRQSIHRSGYNRTTPGGRPRWCRCPGWERHRKRPDAGSWNVRRSHDRLHDIGRWLRHAAN
jgi:hypothetical protein